MSLYEQISDYCSRHKIRLAEKRVIVAEQLLVTDAFTDGDTLWRDMRSRGIKISPATVYESLNWLVSAGFAERRFATDSRKNLFGIPAPVRNAITG
jgi:Fe2+ or Zn2+ uptake regulation protein